MRSFAFEATVVDSRIAVTAFAGNCGLREREKGRWRAGGRMRRVREREVRGR